MDDSVKQISEILEKNGLKVKYGFTFPRYRVLPDEVKLALSVLEKHGMRVEISIEKTETDK